MQIGSLKNSIAELSLVKDSGDMLNTLESNLASVVQTKKDLEFMKDIWSGDAAIRYQQRVKKWLGDQASRVSNAKRIAKDNGNPVPAEILELEQFTKKFANKNSLRAIDVAGEARRSQFTTEMNFQMHGTADVQDIRDNPFMPVDAESHGSPKHKNKDWMYDINKHTNSRDLDAFIKGTDTGINRSFGYSINSIKRAPGFEGIYVKREGMEGLRQFLFRNAMDTQKTGSSTLKSFVRGYDHTNAWIKRIGLYKPTVMMLNDTVQGFFAKNPFMKGSLTAIQDARRLAFSDKKPGSEDAMVYHEFDKNNLFNKSVGFPEMLDDANKTATEFLFADDKMGLKKYYKAIYVKTGMKAEAAEAKANGEYAKTKWIQTKGAVAGAGVPLRWLQESTWKIDEMLRMTVAMPLQKKFYNNYIKSMPEAEAKQKSYRAASDYVNAYMIEYSRIPSSTRKGLNRLLAYPTYRLGTMAMYKKQMVDFTKGIRRSFGANPDNKFMVATVDPKASKKDRILARYQQAAFEVGPAVRSISGKVALKMLAVGMFGGGYEDPFQAMTSYRIRRKEGKDDFWNQEIGVLSFGTPLFDLEKYISRPLWLSVKYNVAAWPRLWWAMGQNQHPITGEELWAADIKDEPKKAAAQLASSLFYWYTPFAQDWQNMGEDTVALNHKLLNLSGIGFYYNLDNPKEVLLDYRKAVNENASFESRQKAKKKFDKRMRFLRHQWFGAKKDKETLFNIQTGFER